MLCFLLHLFLGLCRLEVGAHFAKRHSFLSNFFLRKAVWKLEGGAGDGRVLLSRSGGRHRTRLSRPGRKSRNFVSAGEWFAGGRGPPCLVSILNQIFIATMIGSREAKYKGARRWTFCNCVQ
jgi:hypothetical protein